MPDFLSMLRAFAEGFAIKAFFKMLPANDNNVRYYYIRVFLSILSHYRFHMSNSKHRTSVQKQICTQVHAAWNIRWQPGCPHFLLVDSHRCHIVPHHMIPIWYPYGDGSKPWYLVNLKIAGKWMFIPLKMVLIGIDPYPYWYPMDPNMDPTSPAGGWTAPKRHSTSWPSALAPKDFTKNPGCQRWPSYHWPIRTVQVGRCRVLKMVEYKHCFDISWN